MSKYFMSGTRWEQWERMMMAPSRTAHNDADSEEPEQNQKFALRQEEDGV